MRVRTQIDEIIKELDSLKDTIKWAQEARETENATLDVDRLLFDINNRISYIENRL